MDASDDDLVARTLAGEGDAFAALARRHRAGLVGLMALLTGDPDEAESLAQEALARALAGLGDYRPGLSFRAWLRGIAVNLARTYLRDRTRHARPVDPENLAPVQAREGRRQGVLSGILRQELAEQAERSIHELPGLLREAFVLHYLDGLSYEEMSAATGEAAGTLRVRAHRARTLLRTALGPAVDTWVRGPGDPPA
jgi:RNA polymerase sigma-70 factor (ECF subfamily)